MYQVKLLGYAVPINLNYQGQEGEKLSQRQMQQGHMDPAGKKVAWQCVES